MEEKYMVNDILENTKSEILSFTKAIIISENLEVRQIFEQLRNDLESFNFEMFTLATSKGYYTSTPKAKPEEISQVKNLYI